MVVVKRTFCMLVFVVILLGITPLDSFAGKIAVQVGHTGNDSVGERLVYAVKELIRKSSRFRLTDNYTPRIIVGIHTMNPDGYSTQARTIYSVILTHHIKEYAPEIFIGSWLGYCGSKSVHRSAEGVVASIDKEFPD